MRARLIIGDLFCIRNFLAIGKLFVHEESIQVLESSSSKAHILKIPPIRLREPAGMSLVHPIPDRGYP